ncbi:hypothetical protein [Robbsia sp. KACC 23696]|uniref:hypothetical protein n=1 Tax=Robbsia sp. KACC 23696 TaxID=3149231 RepID=UPI00325C255B
MPPFLDAVALREIVEAAPSASSIRDTANSACGCGKTNLAGWQSVPLSFDESVLDDIGSLIPHGVDEPSYEEYLPSGTTYWTDDAPIAPHYFPYNRCTVSRCQVCRSVYLRYTEGGGYFVDRRIRALDAARIVDIPLADA